LGEIEEVILMANRTRKGNVTAEARRKYGTDGERFPIFDRKSAISALRLRGHAGSKALRRRIIERAARYAPEEARKAREADRKAGKI
jgi:hypothetical protein